MSNAVNDILIFAKNWCFSSFIIVVDGYEKSVIYDFSSKRIFQLSKAGSKLLQRMFCRPTLEEENQIKTILESSRKEFLLELQKCIERLKNLDMFVERKKDGEIRNDLPVDPCFKDTAEKVSNCIVEVTSRCNFHCPHCYLAGMRNKGGSLRKQKIKDVIFETSQLGIPRIQFTGGEPFLRHDLPELITFARDNCNLEVGITTNGSLINRDLAQVLNEKVSKIQITLYGMDASMYRHFSDDETVLGKIFSAIDGLNRNKLQLSFMTLGINYRQVEEFARFCEDKKIRFNVGTFLPIGLGAVNRKALGVPREVIKGIEERYLPPNNVSPVFRKKGCRSDKITVMSNGDVVICPLMRDPRFVLGNVFRKTLEKILTRIKNLEEVLDVDNSEVCRKCEMKYLCAGGCPAIRHFNIDLANKMPPCRIYHFKTYLCYERV